MSKRKGLFRMRFIGKPGGQLMKHAPGNYEHGKIYRMPLEYSQWKFWELIDKPPEVIAPPPTSEDDVYMFIPDEETVSAPVNPELNIDPNTPASVEPYASFNTGTGQLTDIDPEAFTQSEPAMLTTPFNVPQIEEELEEDLTRDELLEILEEAGVEVKPRTRTTTLLKMVAELDSEEDD